MLHLHTARVLELLHRVEAGSRFTPNDYNSALNTFCDETARWRCCTLIGFVGCSSASRLHRVKKSITYMLYESLQTSMMANMYRISMANIPGVHRLRFQARAPDLVLPLLGRTRAGRETRPIIEIRELVQPQKTIFPSSSRQECDLRDLAAPQHVEI